MTTEEITPNKVKSLILSDPRLGEAGTAICLRLLDEHQPKVPPEGIAWLQGGREPHCDGCGTGDPYDDALWPRDVLDAVIETLEAP